MGLEGTLRVFSLTDIFQVLGLQRKSGVLTVEGDDDTVTISFLGGQVVAAESAWWVECEERVTARNLNLGEGQLAGGGIVVKEFRVAAPLNSGFQLTTRFVVAEVLVQ